VSELGIGRSATGRFTAPEAVATLLTMPASERTANITGVDCIIVGGPTTAP
jgi:hypothetical protein